MLIWFNYPWYKEWLFWQRTLPWYRWRASAARPAELHQNKVRPSPPEHAYTTQTLSRPQKLCPDEPETENISVTRYNKFISKHELRMNNTSTAFINVLLKSQVMFVSIS